VKVAGKTNPLEMEEIVRAIEQSEKRFGLTGRILLRPSGTEPVIRVMAEGQDPDLVEDVVRYLAGVVERALG
jgi:phosphoglucosamine mutase